VLQLHELAALINVPFIEQLMFFYLKRFMIAHKAFTKFLKRFVFLECDRSSKECLTFV